MRNYLVILLLFAAGMREAHAQEEAIPAFSLSFSPLSLFLNTVRMEAEYSPAKGSPLLIAISPAIYTGSTTLYRNTRNVPPGQFNSAYDKDRLGGAGAEASIRYVKKTDDPAVRFAYGGIGIGYHHISLAYNDYSWESFTEDGLTYYHFVAGQRQEVISRIDLALIAGLRVYNGRFLFFDFQSGVNYRIPAITTDNGMQRKRPGTFFDYGYKGLLFRFNFAIGFSFFRQAEKYAF